MSSASIWPAVLLKIRLVIGTLLFLVVAHLLAFAALTIWCLATEVRYDFRSSTVAFIVSTLFFAIGILVASSFFWELMRSKSNFDIKIALTKKQVRLGYLFMVAVFAVTSLFYLIIYPSPDEKLLYIPEAITCAVTLIMAVIIRKEQPKMIMPVQQDLIYRSVMPTGDFGPEFQETTHGSASWISDQLKNQLTASTADKTPTFEGLWLGGGFFHHQQGNLVTIAPPGVGKGTALIIPNLLWTREYKHSFVVFDPKGTNACITARYRKQQGDRVIIIDPMGLQKLNNAKHGISPSCFNPLDHIKDDIYNGASQIANLLLPDEPGSKDKYWNLDARNLIQLIIMHIMTCDTFNGYRDLTSLNQVLISGKIRRVLDEAADSIALDGIIADAAGGFKLMSETSDKTFASVLSIASASIKWLSNPALQRTLQQSDFSPSDLEKGGMSIYICQPITNKEGFATFSRLVTGFCLRANAMPSRSSKAWVYYLLDEFPTMGVFPEVIEALAFAREYNMRLWLFAQSLSQLDSVYKTETRNEIVGNATIYQAMGVTDYITQEYTSRRLGNKTIRYTTTGYSKGVGQSSGHSDHGSSSSYSTNESHSTSEVHHGKPLISTDEIERNPHILTLSNQGPMRLFRWHYWANIQADADVAQLDVFALYSRIFNDGRADPNPNFATEEESQEPKQVTDTQSPASNAAVPVVVNRNIKKLIKRSR